MPLRLVDAVRAQSPDVHLSPGTRLGSYEVVEHVGAGGMGDVYRALDTRLDIQDVSMQPDGSRAIIVQYGRPRFDTSTDIVMNWAGKRTLRSSATAGGQHLGQATRHTPLLCFLAEPP